MKEAPFLFHSRPFIANDFTFCENSQTIYTTYNRSLLSLHSKFLFMSIIELSDQEIQRRETLDKMRAMGINPYPAALYPVTHKSSEIKKNFKDGEEVCIAGRLMRRKVQGKASFGDLQDSEGRIQVYFNRDEICPGEDKTLYNDVFKKLLELGDLFGVMGTGFEAQVGELSVSVRDCSV